MIRTQSVQQRPRALVAFVASVALAGVVAVYRHNPDEGHVTGQYAKATDSGSCEEAAARSVRAMPEFQLVCSMRACKRCGAARQILTSLAQSPRLNDAQRAFVKAEMRKE